MEALEAGGPQTIAARAVRESKRRLRPIYWTSMCVLIERLDPADASDDATVDEEPEVVEGA